MYHHSRKEKNIMKSANQELKEAAKNFFQETKSVFKSCTWACVNVDDYNFYGVWGDFKTKQDAVAALGMWAIAFKGGKPEAKVFEGKYRVSISF